MDLLISSLGIPDGVAGWNLLQKQSSASFTGFTKDPVLQREIAYFRKNAPLATSAAALLKDYRLQNFALTAFGLTSEQNMNGLMTKVLNSEPNNTKSFASGLTDSRFTAIADAFNYGGAFTPAVPAVASAAEIAIGGLAAGKNFESFSGKFGGVTVNGLDLSGVTTWPALARTLQTAFRAADGNRNDISVALDGLFLKFTDAKGRGSAADIAFTPNPANTGFDPSAGTPFNVVAGSVAKPAVGGPAVSNSGFIDQIVQRYTEAQFQQVVGNTSNTLREALYAKQQLPTITSWYSVIANRPLADVIQTVLGLPQSFAMINVDQQVKVLSSRMNLADLKDPVKLGTLLNRFVAISQIKTQNAAQSPAAQLLNSVSAGKFNNIVVPTTTLPDSLANNSAIALLRSTAYGSTF